MYQAHLRKSAYARILHSGGENMENRDKPVVLISRCIEFAACRYNGQSISSAEVRTLRPYVNFIPVCPEVEIGLGVPRNAVRLVRTPKETAAETAAETEKESFKQSSGKISEEAYTVRLADSVTGEDHTGKMLAFQQQFLDGLQPPDGCILKGRSPTCGIGSVKIYPGPGKIRQLHSKATGFFGQAVLDRYPEIPVEDEGRLTNLRIREHFLTRLFTLFRFNTLKGTMGALVDFHSRNKYLFMTYNQKLLREAGKITANHDRLSADEVYRQYRAVLVSMFSSLPRISSNVNVLLHIFGYVSSHLDAEEKAFFLDSLERYRNLEIPLIAVTTVLYSWIIRFKEPYTSMQTYFQPFPKGLQRIFDTDKGRAGIGAGS